MVVRKGSMLREDKKDSFSGFSLLELLIVISILAILFGGIGVYRLNHTPSVQIGTAVRTIHSLAKKAKDLALATGNQTCLMVDIDKSSDGYLRSLLVAEYSDEENDWNVSGQVVDLPGEIRVVPGAEEGEFLNWGNEYSVFSDNALRLQLNPDGRGNRDFVYVEFTPAGLPDLFEEADYLKDDVIPSRHLPVLYVSRPSLGGAGEFVFDQPELLSGVSILMNGHIVILAEK